MNDLDRDIREMFRRHEADLVPSVTALPKLMRRTRRRQIGTIAAGTLLIISGFVGATSGLRAVVGNEPQLPGSGGETRTTTINGITITYPEVWFAADPVEVGLEPQDAPRTLPSLMLVLSNRDASAREAFGCPGLSETAAGSVLMTIQEDQPTLPGAQGAAPWPVTLESMAIAGDSGDVACYPKWTFLRASWMAAGRSFEARLGVAFDATDADRAALMEAYESMIFTPESPVESDMTVVGAGTAFDSANWYIKVDTKTGEYCLDVVADSSIMDPAYGSGTCVVGTTPTDAPQVNVLDSSPDGAFAGGTVPADVFAVILETSDGVVGDIGLITPPPGALEGFRYFVVPLPGDGDGTLRFQDQQGQDLYPRQAISWGGVD
jgi:hypothetical protein